MRKQLKKNNQNGSVAQPRRNSTRGIVLAGRKADPPSKHDILAQVWHFVHYVEDLATMPKGIRYNFDASVLQKKCEQVKVMLERAT